MKASVLTGFVLLVATLSVTAQRVPNNNNNKTGNTNNNTTITVTTGSTTYRTKADTAVIDIREKLVQLALQNPDYEVADRTVDKNYYELKKAKTSWLDVFSAQSNVNSITITPNNPNALLYPKWNVGVALPFNFFSQKSNNIKIAKENYMISEAQRNEKYREVKARVLSKYEDYLMFKSLLDLQIRVTQDDYTFYLSKEKDYQDGIILVDEYNKSYKAWAEQQAKKLEAQNRFNIAKIELEQLIGVPLDQVLTKIK